MVLIAGRTGAGKDTLVKELINREFRGVKSYTTRPKRTPDEDTHIFIRPEEAKNYEKAAYTKINGYEYFATPEQVKGADYYIIDPKGIYDLMQNMPDEKFNLFYIMRDEKQMRDFALKRGDKPDVLESRIKDENQQFLEFEERIRTGDLSGIDNIKVYYNTYRDYEICEMADIVCNMAGKQIKPF